MKRFARAQFFATFISVIGLLALATQHAQAQNMRLTGAGGTFPYPIYSAWFQQFSKETSGVQVDYQGVGSGAGIQAFINRTVDFGASDAAMTDEEIAQVESGVVLIPMTAGTIVLGYNLPGSPTALRLPRDVYPEIFLGKITRWNDPKIMAANTNLQMPDLPITVVTRSDASGTNFVFTKHLSAIDADFAKQVGFGTTVQWPSSAKFVGAPKNDGVAATIKQTPGAIGFVEYGYAKFTNMSTALLQNKAGNYVKATAKSGEAALATAKLGPDLRGCIDALFYKEQDDKKATVLRQLVDFCASEDSQALAEKMGYIPLPANVVEKIKAAAAAIK